MDQLIARLDDESSRLEGYQFRERADLLDRLDALIGGADVERPAKSFLPSESDRRAHSIRVRLEAASAAFYRSIREQIQLGERPDLLLQCVHRSDEPPAPGPGYDSLDEVVSGVLQLEEPREAPAHPDPEMVFYQPTPARHIFHFFRLAQLSASDTLIDLGAGLGHVPILTSICTGARCEGIEVEAAYVASARRCAESLNLNRVQFVQQDARTADFSAGSIFYLYTPFRGTILDAVFRRLRHEAEGRTIRIATFGPCTDAVAREPWLEAETPADLERITLLSSRN
ncbi:MAG: class I SAM-dependent methyltransferase [Terracidiphilus sp.]